MPLSELSSELKQNLSSKNMLFQARHLELNKIVGQGDIILKHKLNYKVLLSVAGESGIVYRGYINRGIGKELVAVKTGKGL